MSPFIKWPTIAYATAIFLAGGVSGGAIGYYETRTHMFHQPGEQEMAQRIESRLQNRLGLSPEQMEKIRPVIARAAADLHTIRMDASQRVDEVFENSYAQIVPVLTPEQRTKLNDISRERRGRLDSMKDHWKKRHPLLGGWEQNWHGGRAPESSSPKPTAQ